MMMSRIVVLILPDVQDYPFLQIKNVSKIGKPNIKGDLKILSSDWLK
jgi:hypothetical protein